MRKKAKVFSVLLLTVLLGMLAPTAFAAQEIFLPVKITLTGDVLEEEQTYTLCLEALTPDAPMPNGTAGKTYEKTAAAGDSALDGIPFQKPGIYRYRLFQKAGSDANCVYDARKYLVEVDAVMTAPGKLDTAVVLFQEGSTQKSECAEFVNQYPTKVPDQPSSGPADALPYRSSPVTGDDHILLWAFLGMIVCAVGAAVVGQKLYQKKKNKEK